MKFRWMIVLSSLVMLTGCANGVTTVGQSTHIDATSTFLNYVPPNEPVAPHDMEWIVENAANDLGYYGTSHFPGTITVTEQDNAHITHFKTEDTISANGTTSSKQVQTGMTNVYDNTLWNVDWNINGSDYNYILYRATTGNHDWKVTGSNMLGNMTLVFGN